jgi:hypothetical protein
MYGALLWNDDQSSYGVVSHCSSLASFLSEYSLHYSFPFLLKYDLIFGFNNCDSSIEKLLENVDVFH